MNRAMKISLKTKLIASFLIVVTISGVVATIVGVRVIGNGIVRQAQEKVRLDLNSAREIYSHKLKDIENVVLFTSIRIFIKEALFQKNRALLYEKLREAREKAHLDILTITDSTGRVVARTTNPAVYGDNQAHDELVSRVLSEKTLFTSTQIVSQEN